MAELKQKRLRSREGHVYETREDRVFNVIVVAILAFSILIVAYPLIYVVSASFSSTEAVMAGRVWLLPVDLSLKAYETVFKYDEIMTGYKNALIYTVTGTAVSLVVTSGGTGFSMRDQTPEATMAVADRNAPGIAEAIRVKSLAITDRAMLSRGASVIRKQTLIVNLPGSPKAVRESLSFILGALDHGLGILRGSADN